MKYAIASNVGRRRTSNQDYAAHYRNQHAQDLFILCDGVGGHLAGDVASQRTSQFIGTAFENQTTALNVTSASAWFTRIIEEVNTAIYAESLENQSLSGMGTTLVMAMVIEETLIVGHVGDSRAYILEQGKLRQITDDHSLVNELMKAGELTYEESLSHPHRNTVTQSIGGTADVQSEVNCFSTERLDLLLLCSDGLSNMVKFNKLHDMMRTGKDDRDLASNLINAANDAGGYDNISVILVSEFSVKEVTEWN